MVVTLNHSWMIASHVKLPRPRSSYHAVTLNVKPCLLATSWSLFRFVLCCCHHRQHWPAFKSRPSPTDRCVSHRVTLCKEREWIYRSRKSRGRLCNPHTEYGVTVRPHFLIIMILLSFQPADWWVFRIQTPEFCDIYFTYVRYEFLVPRCYFICESPRGFFHSTMQ